MKLDLALAANLRRPKTLPAIETTKAQSDQLYRVYIQPVRMWDRAWQDQIRPEYERTLSGMATDSVFDIQAIMEAVNTVIVRLTASIWTDEISAWIGSIDTWHMRRFVSNLKYATNIDLSSMIRAGSEPETIDAILQRNVSLVRSVSDQTRERISDAVYRGLTQRMPVRDVAREVAKATGLGRKRALRISSDQTVKMSAALDTSRANDVGLHKWDWQHSEKVHFRPHHKARNGNRYDDYDLPEEIKADLPSYAPFCGCRKRYVVE